MNNHEKMSCLGTVPAKFCCVMNLALKFPAQHDGLGVAKDGGNLQTARAPEWI